VQVSHSMPFGAEIQGDLVRFRLWAPSAHSVDLFLEDATPRQYPMQPASTGWFELDTSEARPGSRYRFQIDNQSRVPDPASRFQPDDVHGPSEVVNPLSFDWNDGGWRGRPWEEAVIYELHTGAFTPAGTFQGIEEKLGHLCDLGVTAIELMPVADFPGKRNWGYDGVLPFAPDSSYGRPEDLKRLVQAAHARGLMVFLDVVYNHFGPEGNYLRLYSPQFLTSRHKTPWGDAINFDGPESQAVREFFIHNALYWLEEYRFDGLRLDAVHTIADDSKPDIVEAIAQSVRMRFGGERLVHLMLEDEKNEAHYLRRDSNHRPPFYDAQWNDDIHHALHVAVTGESDGYYLDFAQHPVQQLCRCLTEGFAFQGDYSDYHHANRGEPSNDLPLSAFISFLQNHDQVGNRPFGDRILQIAPIAAVKAAMEILLLAPSPPLLFMGEEFGATSPFLYFCNFEGDLARAVTEGRRNEFARFAKFSSSELREQIPDPNAEQTFLRSKLNWNESSEDFYRSYFEFYRKLLSLRRNTIVPLLRENPHPRSQCRHADSRALSIDWVFSDTNRLELRANLGPQCLDVPSASNHRLLYARSAETATALKADSQPPWSVLWRLVNNPES
jgi:maltooligosyltrehalose trehalohydrolase